MSKILEKRQKLFNIDIKAVDETSRSITFCFSDDQPDRQNEIVEQSSWNTKNYEKNPLILWGHNSWEPENVLGQGSDIKLNVGGKSFITAQFDTADVNPKADMVFKQLVKRTLRTVSAGFIPHKIEYDPEDNEPPVLKECELLEVSVVPIPANPRAIALALEDGSMSRKDAAWMVKSMKTETELIEKLLAKGDGEVVEKDMEEVKAELESFKTEVQGALKALADSVTTVSEAVTTLVEKSSEHQETDEEKTAREAAEKKAADDAEAKRVADEAEAAKGGHEQSGAAEDEIDPDAELTPELQAQIDAAIPLEDEA